MQLVGETEQCVVFLRVIQIEDVLLVDANLTDHSPGILEFGEAGQGVFLIRLIGACREE